jgi:hypothetical protein
MIGHAEDIGLGRLTEADIFAPIHTEAVPATAAGY